MLQYMFNLADPRLLERVDQIYTILYVRICLNISILEDPRSYYRYLNEWILDLINIAYGDMSISILERNES